jgi:hypothetical protein
MSALKPCPALEWIDSDRIHGLHEACATCPNRAPSAVERELRDCLRDVLAAALIGWELRNRASTLLAKKGGDG